MTMPTRAFRLSFTAAFLFAALMFAGGIPLAAAPQAYTIADIKPELAGDALSITIKGDSQPTYIVTERYSPFRVVLDIANAVLPASGGYVALPKNNFVTYSVATAEEQETKTTRFEFKIAESHAYKVLPQGNDIRIVITPSAPNTGETTAAAAGGSPMITDMRVEEQPGVTTVKLVSPTPLGEYKTGTLRGDKNNPARMFIDIPKVLIGQEVAREKTVLSSVLAKIRLAPRGNTGARVIFDAHGPALFSFAVSRVDDGIQVIIKNDKTPGSADMAASPAATAAAPATVGDTTLDRLIESSSSLLQKSPAGAGGGARDGFLTSGYSRERISVDFYKIDIHNVFRLFREVSNLNIIVDEGVKGTLTLALTDVPWDFALDIICNLMDLSKEQRSNTIVIYPRKKEFAWPSRSEDNLSVNADQRIVEEQALVIQQTESQPESVVRAKELMRNAAKAEKTGDFEQAAAMYEQAVSLNPKNSSALDRLAALYLVNLGINAKALHYAKQSLQVSPQNRTAALYAAIAAANMQQTREASDYFTQSISGNPPMKEALLSFAAFAENNQRYDSALVLLDKYTAQYGDTLNTMVAKARIYDKQNKKARALAQYKAILASGFAIHPDLRRYAQERLAAGQ